MPQTHKPDKVTIIFPSFITDKWGTEWDINPSISAPLGPLYVATAIKHAGYNVKFIDLNVERYTFHDFTRQVVSSAVVGITVYSQNYDMAIQLIKEIRMVNPMVKIICGGPHPSFIQKHIPGADATVTGEVEEFIGDLVTSLIKNNGLDQFPGVIYKSNGNLIKTGSQRIVSDINTSPFPDRDLFNCANYNSWAGIKLKKRIDYIIASRGCPNNCKFCTDPFNKYRARSPSNILSEVQYIAEHKPDFVVFVDDFFFAKRKQSLELLDSIANSGLKIKIVLQTRVDTIDEEIALACKRAGVVLVQLGIESGNQQVIDFYNKKFKLNQVKSAVELIHKYGMFSLGFLIVGAPIEREPQINDTIKLITSIPLDFVAISRLAYRFPSPLWYDLLHKGIITENDMELLADKKTGSYTKEELGRIIKKIYMKFSFRSGHLIRIIGKLAKSRNLFMFRVLATFLYTLVTNFRIFSYGICGQKRGKN